MDSPPQSVPKVHSPGLRLAFFWSGILATLAYRAIIVLSNVDGPWLKIIWYLGTIGFVIYFAHRYQVSERRAEVIQKHDLVRKFSSGEPLNPEDRAVANYVIGTLQSSKERWNYITIFVTSALALAYGLVTDLS